MSKLWVVAKNTYFKNVKSWSFVTMVLSPLIMLAIITGISYFFSNMSDNASQGELPIIKADAGVEQFIKSQPNPTNFKLNFDITEKEAKKKLADDDISGYFVLDTKATPMKATYYEKDDDLVSTAKLQPIVSLLSNYEMAKRAGEYNLSSSQMQALMESQLTLDRVTILGDTENEGNGLATGIRFALGMAGSFVLFFFVIYYSMLIMQEIASEKGSRIMEIILSSMGATTHFFGKLLGVVLMILTHILIYVVVFGGIAIAYKTDMLPMRIPEEITSMLSGVSIVKDNLDLIIWVIIYGILGIILYSMLAAFIGSLVSRTEDVQKAATPLTFLLLIGFYIGIFGQEFADSPFYVIASHIPFFSASIMPLRLAKHLVAPWELGLSIIIYLLAIVIISWLSITFYRSNVLVYSDAGFMKAFKQSVGTWKSESKGQA
ncbi:MAG: ABC transporter permease [Aerococcus sp.]|nr:ABC transporter permease [Aerococcus sp.]